MPPVWRPGIAGREVSQLRFYQQFDGLVEGQTAWTMLDELEGGRIILRKDVSKALREVRGKYRLVDGMTRTDEAMRAIRGRAPGDPVDA